MAVVALLIGSAVEWQRGQEAHDRQEQSAANGGVSPFHVTGMPAPPAQIPKHGALRPVYGHALVRGGIRSTAELLALINADPQLAEHYKGFDLSKAHIITLDHDVVAYVSYRFGKGIYWKTRPTIIRTGEEVVTDGANFIRAACGNRIAYAPGMPTNAAEPEDVGVVVGLTFVDDLAPVAVPQPSSSPTDDTTLPLPAASLPLQSTNPGNGGSGGVAPPFLLIPGRGGVSQFSADEFSTISMAVFQHSVELPTTLMTLVAGILLVLALRFSLRRMD